MKKTNNKGFSLVELIVVIAIMAVLIAVLAPSFIRYVEQSRQSTDKQNAAAMVTAVQVWAVDVSATTANDLTTGKYVIKVDGTGVTFDGGTFAGKTISQTDAEAALKAAFDNAGLATTTKCESRDWTEYQIHCYIGADGTMRVFYSPEELGRSTTCSN